MPASSTLAAAVKHALQHQQMSIVQLAERLEYPPGTLRSWISRNVFPEQGARDIAVELGLVARTSRQSLSVKYQFRTATVRGRGEWAEGGSQDGAPPVAEPTRLLAAFAHLDRRSSQLAKHLLPVPSIANELFGALERDDVFCLCCTDPHPYEATKVGWRLLGEAAIRAVQRGAQFVYLRPSAEAIEAIHRGSGVRIANYDAVKEKQDELEMRLRNDALQRHVPRTLYLDTCPFFLVGHVFVLYHCATARISRSYVMVPLRLGTLDGDDSLLAPLSSAITEAFESVICSAARQEGIATALDPQFAAD